MSRAPRDPAQRARVRALAQVIACDIHPIANLRVQSYLRAELAVGDEGVGRWIRHWIATGFEALEAQLEDATRYSCGDAVSLADVCLVPQHFNAVRFGVPLEAYPKLNAVVGRCQDNAAFAAAHPDRQT